MAHQTYAETEPWKVGKDGRGSWIAHQTSHSQSLLSSTANFPNSRQGECLRPMLTLSWCLSRNFQGVSRKWWLWIFWLLYRSAYQTRSVCFLCHLCLGECGKEIFWWYFLAGVSHGNDLVVFCIHPAQWPTDFFYVFMLLTVQLDGCCKCVFMFWMDGWMDGVGWKWYLQVIWWFSRSVYNFCRFFIQQVVCSRSLLRG